VIESSRKRGRRQSTPLRWLVAAVAAALLFAVGIALGEALKDNPKPNLTVTTTKTIVP
jgi:drug/metabolite transporter (DMT)-like permease